MARPMWNGSISFGLVNVPVKMFNSVKKKTLHFNQLRASDGCRIRLKKVCSNDGAEVESEDIIRGYEISPERYVTVTDEELQVLNPKTTRSIDIEDFVSLEEIDPIYFEQSYYLVPDKGAAKAYSLLFAAMKKTNKIAIARIVMRNKQYLAAIRPAGRALSLATMYFADEIVSQNDLEALPADIEPNERELTMAEQLITSLSSPFEPEKYKDEYREKVLDLIEKKAEGQTVTLQPAAPEGGKVIDLMAALEASLKAMKKEDSPESEKPVRSRRKKASAQ
ncbi:Ku protein [Anaerospora sp.]|uniref:non-homologous end joining protein Ku n=1 Tax=Anaerospora sp. TaxID=1960278 RepID=UPI00289BBF10|nr:Ku protein [Anaerospora sp.]